MDPEWKQFGKERVVEAAGCFLNGFLLDSFVEDNSMFQPKSQPPPGPPGIIYRLFNGFILHFSTGLFGKERKVEPSGVKRVCFLNGFLLELLVDFY